MNKTTKKVTLQILFALTLASASLTQLASNNCYLCTEQGKCDECYERKMLKDSKGRYTSCSPTPQPASDPCLLYMQDFCFQYKPGWANNISSGGPPYVKSTIKNCIKENFENGRHICGSCLGGCPSQDYSRCIPPARSRTPSLFVPSDRLRRMEVCIVFSVSLGTPPIQLNVLKLLLGWRVACSTPHMVVIFATSRMGTL